MLCCEASHCSSDLLSEAPRCGFFDNLSVHSYQFHIRLWSLFLTDPKKAPGAPSQQRAASTSYVCGSCKHACCTPPKFGLCPVMQVCMSMQLMHQEHRSFRYTHRTACTARHAASRTQPRTSSGQSLKEAGDPITPRCNGLCAVKCHDKRLCFASCLSSSDSLELEQLKQTTAWRLPCYAQVCSSQQPYGG